MAVCIKSEIYQLRRTKNQKESMRREWFEDEQKYLNEIANPFC